MVRASSTVVRVLDALQNRSLALVSRWCSIVWCNRRACSLMKPLEGCGKSENILPALSATSASPVNEGSGCPNSKGALALMVRTAAPFVQTNPFLQGERNRLSQNSRRRRKDRAEQRFTPMQRARHVIVTRYLRIWCISINQNMRCPGGLNENLSGDISRNSPAYCLSTCSQSRQMFFTSCIAPIGG